MRHSPGAPAAQPTGFGSGEDGFYDRAWNALESGALGTLGGGAFAALGQGFNKLLGAVSRRPELRELAPTLQGLRDEASRLYTEARKAARCSPRHPSRIWSRGSDRNCTEAIDPDLHPRLKAVLNRLEGEGGDKTLPEVEILRRVAGNAAQSQSPDEGRLARLVIDKIDDAIDGMPQGGDAMRAARETWGRLRRMEVIETAMERASLAKADFTSALQSEFRALAKNARKLRGFSGAGTRRHSNHREGWPAHDGIAGARQRPQPQEHSRGASDGWRPIPVGPGALALPVTSFATRKIADALSRRAGQNVRDNVGRSDANRRLVEALMGRANPLAGSVPAAGILGALMGDR